MPCIVDPNRRSAQKQNEYEVKNESLENAKGIYLLTEEIHFYVMNLTDWSVSAYLETLPPALDVSSLHPVTFSPPDLSRNDDVIQVIMLNNSAQPGISISNLTSPVEETCRFRPTTENYLVVVAFIAIFLLSVIGNALVIVVIMQQRAMRSITNIYLMNLAITDLMLSVVCMPPTLGQ
uniref:G_PROTEIN_RECEP_F1_2 domain-containing protein n=1 Tax=Heterorhabditis bacteriophora TaxID=37862 RepID=A0A1I7X6T6_HETBA